PEERGGDGERSITWLEVEAARAAGRPVLAFLVDPSAPWAQKREQDRLVDEPHRALEIARAVQKLEKFRAFLRDHCTVKTFRSADERAARVPAALHSLPAPAERDAPPRRPPRLSVPGLFRYYVDRCLPRPHLKLTQIGAVSRPPELDELHAY